MTGSRSRRPWRRSGGLHVAGSVLVVLWAAVGCADTRQRPDSTRRDSAGIEIVENERPEQSGVPGWSVASSPSVEIGSGGPEQQLYRVRDATRLSDGRIAVLNATDELLFYDAGGSFLRTVAGSGEGPGELRYARDIVRLPGDTILLYDSELGRLNTFGRDGELVGSRRLRLDDLPGFDRPPLSASRGDLVSRDVALVDLSDLGASTPEMSRTPKTLAWIDLETMTADTLGWYRDTQHQTVELASVGRPIPLYGPHAPGTVTAVGGNPFRLLIGDQSAPEFHEYRDGELRRIVRWIEESRPLTDRDVELWRGGHMAWLAGDGSGVNAGLTESQGEQVLDRVDLPSHRPSYDDLHVDSQGYVWVGDARFEYRDRGRYRIFSSDGRWLGSVTVPPLRVLEVGDDYILGLYEDAMDVQHVRVYELER